jgi:hypothetical protein
MGASQRSFETRFGRFVSANELVQAKTDYEPIKTLIKKPSLVTFIADVAAKDQAVNLTYLHYRENVMKRRVNGFRDKANLENCLENRIRNSMAYVGAEIGRTSPAYKMIKDFIKKIAPKYKKKEKDAPKGEGKSPSEQSFVALIGYGKQTAQITGDLGAAFNPSDPDIKSAAMLTFCETMETYTTDIAKSEILWAEAVKQRKAIYDGTDGMAERIVLIKDYLASFAGGKKSQDYIEFDRLIKGK